MSDEPTVIPPTPSAPPPPYGPPSAQAPAGLSPAAPKRRTGLIAAGSGALGLVIGLAIGAAASGASDGTTQPLPTPVASTTSDAPAATSTSTPDVGEPDPEPTEAPPAATSEPTTAEGTRANPFTVGDAVGNDDWKVTLGTPAESWKAIKAENQFNDPAPKGFEYYMVPVSATYTGTETGTAWVDLRVEFVGEDGVTYTDSCGVLPDNLNDVGELYEGGKAKGNVCVTVPEGAKGLWTLAVGWGDPVFFTAGK